jgi:hypothetical protein
MGIRDALAAEGNSPLVFMGGTSTGPKWRERLVGQVAQPFRWFNPIVEEWTAAAKDTEVEVRAEADILLYVITPYQEGCYSFVEMTEDAVRSEKPVVICFLPSFEDKAYSEQQWSSIISAQTLLEKHKAIVLLSMEQLVDWFSRYNVTSPDSKLLDTQTLVDRAKKDGNLEPKPAPSTAAGLTNALTEDRAEEFSRPAKAEAGTTPAQPENVTTVAEQDEGLPRAAQLVENVRTSTESLDISSEGIFDSLVGLLRGKREEDEESPGDTKDGKPVYDYMWAKDQRAGIERTFGNAKWVEANFKAGAKPDAKIVPRLAFGKDVLKPAEGFKKGIELVTEVITKLNGPIKAYDGKLHALESEAERRVNAGEDGNKVAKDILAKATALKGPISEGYMTPELAGGYVMRFTEKTDDVSRMIIQINPKTALDVPELSVEDVKEAGKLLATFAVELDKLFSLAEVAGLGCDSGIWVDEEGAFAYDAEYGEELWEQFYHQDRPQKYSDFSMEPIFLLAQYMRNLGRWLQACTK